jgi:hypothetical protein
MNKSRSAGLRFGFYHDNLFKKTDYNELIYLMSLCIVTIVCNSEYYAYFAKLPK